jgi:hypothetical protein
MAELAEALAGLVICDERSSRKPRRVGLVCVEVEAMVNDFCAHVTVDQEYVNDTDGAVDVKYVFPLDESGNPIYLYTYITGGLVCVFLVKL